MTKQQFVNRALARSEKVDDYWGAIAAIVKIRPGIGITDRKYYSQRCWNWMQQAKAQLWEPGD